MDAVAHLTCVGSTVEELREVLVRYQLAGITNLLALRGDPPGGPGSPWTPVPGRPVARRRAGRAGRADRRLRHRSGRLPRAASRVAGPGDRRPGPRRQAARRCQLRDHPVLLRRPGLLLAPGPGDRPRGEPADPARDHAGHRHPPDRAVRAAVRRGFPARARRPVRGGAATTPLRWSSWASRWPPSCARSCSRAGPPGCTSIRSTGPPRRERCSAGWRGEVGEARVRATGFR